MGAAGEEGGDERFRSWYLSREEIERGSPSRRDGVSATKEAELRATYCSFIRDVCLRLQLPQITYATAIMLCHRFYLRQSLARNEWQMEDTPCKLEFVVTVAYETMYRKNPDTAKRIQHKEVLDKQKALILVGETLLLSTIRFDFNIQHPYEPLKIALKNLGISQKEVRQVAITLINDTLPTTLVVQFQPHYIAAGALFVAAKFHNIRLPSETGNILWQKIDVAPNQLQAVTQQMTELFKKRNPSSTGPAIKPTTPPTPMDKRQIISTPDPTLRHTQSSQRRISNSDTVASRCIPPTPTLMDKRQIISTSDPTLRHTQSSQRRISNSDTVASRCVPPTPTLMDKRQIISTPDPTLRHAQSSRRSISNSDTVASRCVPVDSSFYNKSVSSSARNEANQSVRAHINLDQMIEKQCPRETLKADRVYRVCSGPKDMNVARIRDLTRQKRRIQEAGKHPAPFDVSDKGAWIGRQLTSVIVVTNSSRKKQKLERR